MFFQGTKNRKQAELEVEVDTMGGLLNAHISRELTVYYIKCFKSDMARGRQQAGGHDFETPDDDRISSFKLCALSDCSSS